VNFVIYTASTKRNGKYRATVWSVIRQRRRSRILFVRRMLGLRIVAMHLCARVP
jgi:hypothetical protein